MASGSSPREGNPRRLVYRVRNAEGEYRRADGGYGREGKTWGRRSHLVQHLLACRHYVRPAPTDVVVEYELVEQRTFPVEEL